MFNRIWCLYLRSSQRFLSNSNAIIFILLEFIFINQIFKVRNLLFVDNFWVLYCLNAVFSIFWCHKFNFFLLLYLCKSRFRIFHKNRIVFDNGFISFNFFISINRRWLSQILTHINDLFWNNWLINWFLWLNTIAFNRTVRIIIRTIFSGAQLFLIWHCISFLENNLIW